jgi:ribosomal protein S18 acetylase RimI-like enzyme
VNPLEVRQAGLADVDVVTDLLTEAARWLLARGIEQWPDPFPRDRVEAVVRRGEFFLAKLDGMVAATLALMWSDPTFWGERPGDAGYVHALAVRRAFAGRALGEQLLAWAEQRVAEAGREFLRLDCRSDNSVLQAYYERLGFERQGDVHVDEFVSTRFQRRCRLRQD